MGLYSYLFNPSIETVASSQTDALAGQPRFIGPSQSRDVAYNTHNAVPARNEKK